MEISLEPPEKFYRILLTTAQRIAEETYLLLCKFFRGIQQQESITAPEQCFTPVMAPATEYEQIIREWIQPEIMLNYGSQAIWTIF